MPYPNPYFSQGPLDALRWREAEEYASGPDDEAERIARGMPYPTQARGALAALLPQDDPGMDARWRQAETQALDRAGEDPAQPNYGWAEGVRDIAPMAIGSILDILINKGQGLGALAAGGMQALQTEQTRRDDRQKEAARQALAIRQQRQQGGDQAINRMHALLREQEVLRQTEEMNRLHPPQTEADLARKAEGEQAEIDLNRARANEAESQAYGQWMYPGLGSLMNVARFQEAVMQHGLENTRANEAAETRKQQLHDQKFDRFNTRTVSLVPVAQMLRAVDQTIAAVRATDPNADIPGVGGTSFVPFPLLTPEGKTVRNSTDFMEQVVTRKWSGAAIPKHEMEVMRKAIRPGATDEDYLKGLEALRRVMLGELRRHGQAAGTDIAREALDVTEKGLYNYVYGIQEEDPDAPKQPKPTGTMVSPDAPPSVRGTQPPASSPQQPQPSAAPSTQTSPEPRDEGPLWAKIPQNQRDAVYERIKALPESQHYDALYKLAHGIALEPDTTAQPETRRPPPRVTPKPTPPPATAPAAPTPTPPPGDQPEPEADVTTLTEEELKANIGDPRYLQEYTLRLQGQFEAAQKLRNKPTDQLDLTDELELKEYARRQYEQKRLPGARSKGKAKQPTAGEPTDEDLQRLPESKLDPNNPRHAREIRRRRAEEAEKRVPGVRRRGGAP